MQKLSKKDTLLVGLTLFSMFFGAGNLIFPPFLGAQAGTQTWIAMAGFALSAVGLPVLGVVAVAKSGGLPALANRVGRPFSAVFTMLTYLSIGPCLAIPRTASTSYEMAVTPFAGETPSWVLVLYSFVFFSIALLVALRPEKLTNFLGRFTGPTLLILILVIFVGCLMNPPGGYGPVTGIYTQGALAQGFIGGYQTMDTIAALNFGIVIALNIQNRGITEEKSVVRTTIRAGWIAGSILLLVYAILAHVGAISGGSFPGASNGTGVLSNLVDFLFGPIGSILLGAVFVIACLNTCIGLLCACGEYFYSLFPKVSAKIWIILFALFSFLISNLGLDWILFISSPVLSAIYPVAIVLIVMGLAHRWIEKFPLCYPTCVLFTGVISVAEALASLKIPVPFLKQLPFASYGLAWIVPAIVGLLLGILLSVLQKRRNPSAPSAQ